MTLTLWAHEQLRVWAAEQAGEVMRSFENPWIPADDEGFAKLADLFYNYAVKGSNDG